MDGDGCWGIAGGKGFEVECIGDGTANGKYRIVEAVEEWRAAS